MRRSLLCSQFLLLVTLGMLAPGAAVGAETTEETLVLVADAWPPFNGVAGSKHEGYMIDLARAIFAEHHITIDYRNIPWKRAIEGTRSGRYDAAVGASRFDGKGLVFPDEELARNRLAFYVRKDDPWRFKGAEALADVSLGVIKGYDYRAWLAAYIARHRDDPERIQEIAGENAGAQNLAKLLAGRVRAIVDSEIALRTLAQEKAVTDRVAIAGFGSEVRRIYIALAPQKPDSLRYATLLSEGLRAMRRDGRLKTILDRYGLDDWAAVPLAP